jgi:hypothetical protein
MNFKNSKKNNPNPKINKKKKERKKKTLFSKKRRNSWYQEFT